MKINQIKFFIVLLMIFVSTACFLIDSLPSDKKLEQIFERKSSVFDKIVKMFKEDADWNGISLYSTSERINYNFQKSGIKPKLSAARMEEYVNLFKEAKVKGIERNSKNPDVFYLQVSNIIVDDSDFAQIFVDEKGYVYSEEESESGVTPILDSLDDSDKIDGKAFKHLSDNWYLAYYQTIRRPE